jgi:predicted DNA-binding transcriptional regulator AlpA
MIAERALVGEAMQITGLKRRTLQSLAQRGHIPGAGKLGATWTFDRTRLRQWIAAQERAACHRTSTAATAFITPAFKLAVTTSAEALKLVTAGRLRGA